MSTSGETADQMMKMTLEGIEVAAKVVLTAGGDVSKSLAATLYAILTDKKKVKGRASLDAMLKSGKELKVFAISHKDLKTFCEEAKHYGVLYSVLKEKNNTDGICDIMVRAEDASKICRIVDKFELATIDTKALRQSILAGQNAFENVPKLTDEQHDELVNKLREELKNPTTALMDKKGNLSEHISTCSKENKTSVRRELAQITAEKNKTPKTKPKRKGKVK